MAGIDRPRRREAGASEVQDLVNSTVKRRRKPRWARKRLGSDKGRETSDPGVGVGISQGYETP